MGMSQEEIEALMNGIGGSDEPEASEPETNSSDDVNNDNIDDLLNNIDGIVEDDKSTSDSEEKTKKDPLEIVEEKIEEGVFPLPVEKEHKVVSQLSEVANDSENKASQIFDVLSFVLDENGEIESKVNGIKDFLSKEKELLQTLSTKFPNIPKFKEHLQELENIESYPDNILDQISQENNKLFEAMELMQFNDINRQKIERVMMVIKKLTVYLNNLFGDDAGITDNLPVAKHLDGDFNNELVSNDDLDSLIAEFNKG